jgi:integrase
VASLFKREPSRTFPKGSWQARYRDPEGKQVARQFARKIDAQRWLDEKTAAIVTSQYVAPGAGRVTVREYTDAWLASQVHRDNTAELYEGHIRRHAYPAFGDAPIDSILPSTIQGWVKSLSIDNDSRSALAPSTIEIIYGVTASVFRTAVRDRKIARTPCESIKLPEVVKTRIRPISTEQVDALADGVPPMLRAAIILAAGTGMRQGEVLGLTRDRLRLLGKDPKVTVDRQLVTKPGAKTEFAPPKTPASVRTIPLPQVVITALNDHIATFKVGERDLMFTLEGEGITRQRFGHMFRPVGAKVGLTEETGTGMHALRHYYASLLIRFGENVKTIQARLGHKSATETLDTYSHLWPDSDDRTRLAIDSVLGADREHSNGLRSTGD